MAATPSELSDALAPAADVCYRCGYNLVGILNDRPCPECGLLAERSRRVTDELHNTRPGWLRNLSRGVWLILIAMISPLVANHFMEALAQYLYANVTQATLFRYRGLLYGRNTMPFLIAACIFLVGVFLVSRPEGFPPADRKDRWRRIALRLFGVAPLVSAALNLAAWQWYIGTWSQMTMRRWQTTQDVLVAAATIGCAPLPLLLFYQLRSLAKRARSAHLAEHCAIVGIGTSIAVLYVGAMTLTSSQIERTGSYWVSRSNIWFTITLIAGVAGFLFALWSLYLLIRFAISFHKAARQMKTKWRRDDHSTASLDQ